MLKFIFRFSSVVLLTIVASYAQKSSASDTKLTSEEVQQIFIGKPWNGPGGVFLFKKDGTYSYKKNSASKAWGPWTYTLKPDGTIIGTTTKYTFYRSDGGYKYFHSKSNRFYIARPSSSN